MQLNILKILIILIDFYLMNGYAEIRSSIGEIWPKPTFERKCITKLLDPNNFEFVIVGETCDILAEALIRYTKIIKQTIKSQIIDIEKDILESGIISKVDVNLTTSCERFPHLEMDESYKISGSEYISANSIWGILRGLETYSQVITPTSNGMLNVPHMKITDYPRFPHRGLMLDTARHYIKVDTILTILDGMAYNKLNVFHWHIVDDESFPYQSIKFPELSEKGAFKPRMVYTQENISNIIEYARMRGIRVVAEFDMPGHSRSWGNSHPEILTTCEWWHPLSLGPIDPIRKRTYDLLQDFLSEIVDVFPDNFMHLGGNEVNLECWKSNDDIINYNSEQDLSPQDLYDYFMKSVSTLIIQKSITPIVWQEAIFHNLELQNDVIIQVQLENWKDSFKNLTRLGYRVILSECWSLNNLSKSKNINDNWKIDYNCDPHDFYGTAEQKKLVIGGEAIIWTHLIGNHNLIQSIFPRISAMAERLWSKHLTRNITEAAQRLEEHTCRMILRGIPAESPSGLEICG